MCKPVPPNVGVRLREYAETGNSKQLEILLEKYKGNVVINEKDNGHGEHSSSSLVSYICIEDDLC